MAPKAKALKLKDETAEARVASSSEIQVNEPLYKRLADNVARVMDTKLFKRIERESPLDIGNGGYQTPYNAEDFKTSIKANKLYKCGFNLFAMNLQWSAMPGVPLVEARVDLLLEYYFKRPAAVPFDFVIRIPNLDFDPMTHLGGLQCLTPEEVKMAFLKAVVRDLSDEGRMQEWRRVALTATAVFKVLETEDDVFFEAFNARERLVNDFQALARTAFQRIHEVAQFRQRKMSAWGPGASLKKLCEEFNKRAELAASTEPVNLDFIQKAMNIFDKAFSIPGVVQAIEALEALCKKSSPYDSVHKLAGIVRKAKDAPVIEWVFATITDLVVAKKSQAQDFPHRWLLGDASGRGGAVDMYIMKHRMLDHLLTKQLDVLGLPSQVKEKMREVLANRNSYRKFLNPLGGSFGVGRRLHGCWRRCRHGGPRCEAGSVVAGKLVSQRYHVLVLRREVLLWG